MNNAATTKPYAQVLGKFSEVSETAFGNSGSLHTAGREAAAYLEEARDIAAAELGCEAKEIYFTSGATEADNMALIGYARANADKGRHLIISSIEHPAVLRSAAYLEAEGYSVSCIPPMQNGVVNAEDIFAAVREDTILISLMYINNELGTFQPVCEVAEFASARGIAFHTDAVQAFGKYDINVKKSKISLLSASSHKIHGPKCVGLIYIDKNVKISPVCFGGGQERGMRSGTADVAGIAAFGKAIELSSVNRSAAALRVKELSDELLIRLAASEVQLNGAEENRSGYILNVFVPGVKTDEILYLCDQYGLYVSAGSACSAGSVEPTHVIKAIGRSEGGASVRFSLSRETKKEEINEAADIFAKCVSKLRK